MKLKRLIAPLLLALCVMTAHAATRQTIKVDLNGIRVDATMNPSKYRALLDRFIDGDETLTLDEMAAIYYGFPTTYDYNPTRRYNDVQKAFNDNDYAALYDLATAALERDPLSLNLLAKAIVGAENKTDATDAATVQKLQTRYDKLVQLILRSGLGTMPDSPFIVISESDLQALIYNVFYITDILERGYFGLYDVVKAKQPGGEREIVLFFDNTMQSQYEASTSN